jgi:phage terminase large subunit GpA-like protein
MIGLLNKTISELKNLIQDASASDAINISAILKAIKNKTPHLILKEVESLERLDDFNINKEACEKKSIEEIKEFLSGKIESKLAIDVLIHLHILILISSGKKDPVKWPVTFMPGAGITVHLPEKDYKKAEVEWLLEQISDLTDQKISITVSEAAELGRILPNDTPIPGPYKNETAPYLEEPMNSCSETSSTEYEVWLKGHQLGFTLAVENIIYYIIKYAPGPILYSTASDSIGKEWSENRFDPMIAQCGLQGVIASQTVKKNSKKTGDKTLLKEFPGGRIKIAGYGSSAAFRSSSYRYFFGDEIDEASADLKKQGNALEQAEGRTSAFKTKRKIILFSTPIEKDNSNVYAAYLLGDQRKYFVPCPSCGFMQELKFEHIAYKVDDDNILDTDSVRYKCQNEDCSEYFYNFHKPEIYASGKCEWRATAKARRQNYISRQISCLYAPTGMITWSDVIQKYLDALESGDPGKMKTFYTLWLGLPYEEKGEAPDIQVVRSHRSNYQSKTVPNDVLFLTLGADVQGDRLELEICGHGRRFKTWSIDYVVIPGDTKSVTKGAWPKFREAFLSGEFIYTNKKGSYGPQMAFIDSNYRTDTVVEFCETLPGLYPIVGQDKFQNPQQKFRITDLPGSNIMSVRLATNYFKDIVYSSLRTESSIGQETPVNYPAFPFNYDDKYFKGLNSEYKRGKRIGNKIAYEYYCPKGRRNEPLDCRVYNLGAREVLFFKVMDGMKEDVEKFEESVHRKILVSEKTEWFYSYMEKISVFNQKEP